MTNEATDTGVSESEDYGFGADRLAKINAIQGERTHERNPESDDEDLLAILQDQAEALNSELAGHESDEEDEPEPKTPIAPAPTDSESPLFMADGQWMARIKVDGEVKEIPYARLQAAAQKLDAGDKRMEEASRLRQEIDTREQQLLQREQQLKTQPPAQGADGLSQTENGQDMRAIARKYHEALLNGDDDDVTSDLLAQLTTAGRGNPTIDVAQIAEQVERQVEARIAEGQRQAADREQDTLRKTELRDAFSTFKDEFKDVAADKELLQMADRLTVTVSQEYPTYTPIEVMREAGRRTRHWLADKTGGTVRTNRKRNLKTATGTGAIQPGTPAVQPKTRTDQLNEIRSARGQVPIG